jgi:exodeoxyribonuclease VII small subunit
MTASSAWHPRMSNPPDTDLTFEQALAELERIVRELEDGQTGLEEALTRYEAGIGLLKRCYGQLRQAEQRILLLTGVDDEGRPVAQSFTHAATLDSGKAEVKKRVRKKGDGEPEIPF